MPGSLFDAPKYDPAAERRRKVKIVITVAVVIVIAALLWFNRYWPQQRRVEGFFAQLQAQNYEAAYGIWMNDPNWKEHTEAYRRYPYAKFYEDWGPDGEWGPIRSYRVVGAIKSRPHSSGVVIGVRVNGRKDLCSLWVEFKDKSLGFSPDQMVE
jgi:hypothetical protein